MKKILVATDLSDRSDIALRRASSIARRSEAKLHVIHVVDGDWPLIIGDMQKQVAEKFITSQLAKIEDTKALDVEISFIFGDPSIDIASTAVDLGADLIVIGRHRDRGIAEFFRGTTIERMARTSAVPILVARREPVAHYARAVVGLDFSTCSSNAVSLATELVGANNVALIHAYHVPFKNLTMSTDRTGSISATDKRGIEDDIRREVDIWLNSMPIKIEKRDVILHEGSAIDILPRVAEELGSDLICVGAHSRSWLSSAILGSTAHELLSYSNFDILIVPLCGKRVQDQIGKNEDAG